MCAKNDILSKFYKYENFDFGLSPWLTGPLGLRQILIIILEILGHSLFACFYPKIQSWNLKFHHLKACLERDRACEEWDRACLEWDRARM